MAGCFFDGGSFGEHLQDQLGVQNLALLEFEHESVAELGQGGGGHRLGRDHPQLEPDGRRHHGLDGHGGRAQDELGGGGESFTDVPLALSLVHEGLGAKSCQQ